MNLKSFSPSQIHIAGGALLILVLAASAYAIHTAYQSQQSGIQSSQIQLTQVSDQLATAQRDRARLVNQISKLQTIVQDHQPNIQPASINELAVVLVALAEKHTLQLEQFEPSPPTTLNAEPIQSISIRLSAPYQSITNWLNELYESRPDIHVTALSIKSTSPTATTVISDIRLNWYIPTSPTTAP